jgi:Protein of unknown function (DUF2384)
LLGSWFQTPNPAFGGLKPVEIIERGAGDRRWAMVYFLRAGVPTCPTGRRPPVGFGNDKPDHLQFAQWLASD